MSANETENTGRVSVSEEKLKRILAEERVWLIEQFSHFATRDMFDRLLHEIEQLKLWRAARDAANEEKRAISSRQLAIYTIIAALIGSISTLVWLHPTFH